MQIVRYADLAPVPWKNGLGLTREVVRHPGSGPFRWRLSMAEVGQSGPFSEFAGYQRVMVLLEGQGLALHIQGEAEAEGGAGGVARTLRRVGDVVEFAGAARVRCELLQGPCVDLNLMYEESLRPSPVVRVVDGATLRDGLTLGARADGVTVVVALAGGIALEGGARGGGGSGGVDTQWLERWDTALLVPEDGEVRLAGAAAGAGAWSTPAPVAHRGLVIELKYR